MAGTCQPTAHAFEIAGRTIWAPALLHFVIQGAIKLISIDGDVGARRPLIWMAASATLPFLVFLARRHESEDAGNHVARSGA
jgi:hypothetical protein